MNIQINKMKKQSIQPTKILVVAEAADINII